MPERVEKLKAQRDRINARLRQLKGRETRETRKVENRRKILAGAFLLEQAKRDPKVNEWMMHGLTWFLTRPEERELFGLTPRLVTDKAEAEGGQAVAPSPAPELPAQPAELRQAGV